MNVKLLICWLLFILSYAFSTDENKPESSSLHDLENKKDEEKKDNETQKNEHSQNYFYNKSFFKLAPFNITIFKNGEVESVVQIECAMHTSEENWDKLRLQVPILYHHIFIDLYQSLNFLWDRTETPSANTLKKRIMTVCNNILGEGKIKNVLIGAIAITPRSTTG
jgi:flagellar basal body-associated protein FliL